MGPYRFRIRFHLNAKGVLLGDGSTLCASIGDSTQIALRTESKKNPIGEADRLFLHSGPYETESKAWDVGGRIKDALLLTCASMRIAVDVGNDSANHCVGERVKAAAWEAGKIRIHEDVHGLMVYDSSERVSFSKSDAIRLAPNSDAQEFLEELTQNVSLGVTPSEKQRLAMELLGFSRFETSVRARFLTCMLAYETLLEPEKKPEDLLAVLTDLQCTVENSNLDAGGKHSLKSALGNLKRQSIIRAGKALASRHLVGKRYDGLAADRFFGDCYDARSSLVHEGKAGMPDSELGSLAVSLEIMLSDLLTSMLLPRAKK